jgi:hypothetical protein
LDYYKRGLGFRRKCGESSAEAGVEVYSVLMKKAWNNLKLVKMNMADL